MSRNRETDNPLLSGAPARRVRIGRRPAKHAMPAGRPARSAGDMATTLGVLVVLVLTSAFVVGTTASFTASTSNAGNSVATTALRAPTGAAVDGVGSRMKVSWTAPASFTPDGYRITEKDHGAALAANLANPSNCSTVASGYDSNEVGLLAHHDVPTTHAWTDDLSLGSHLNAVDGRLWCYRVQSRTPCCVINSNAWLSQDTANNNNGHTVAQGIYGMTLEAFTSVNVAGVSGDLGGTNKLNPNDYFEFTFSQPVDVSTKPTGTICTSTNATNWGLYIGMSGTSGACNFAATGEFLTGFYIKPATTTASSSRYNMTVTFPGCALAYCSVMRITVGTNVTGTKSPAVAGASMSVSGTANGTNLDAYGDPSNSIAARNWCASGTATNLTSSRQQYMANPTNGRCVFTGLTIGI